MSKSLFYSAFKNKKKNYIHRSGVLTAFSLNTHNESRSLKTDCVIRILVIVVSVMKVVIDFLSYI